MSQNSEDAIAKLKTLLAAEIDRAGRAQVRGAELDREIIHLTNLLMACADLNIPFPDPAIDDGEYARGIRTGHKEARDYCANIAQKAFPRNRFNCGETIKQDLKDRAARAIFALRAPDHSLARVPNTIRQSIADIIEELGAEAARFEQMGMGAKTDGAAKAFFGVSAGLKHAKRIMNAQPETCRHNTARHDNCPKCARENDYR